MDERGGKVSLLAQDKTQQIVGLGVTLVQAKGLGELLLSGL